MSLWRQRTAIDHAVAGLLGPEDEAKLRSHLRGCHECRRYYDELTVKARILAGDPHTTPSASERELARLLGAIEPAPPRAAEAPAWWPRLAVAAGIAAAVVFGLISFRQSQVTPAEPIGWRGAPAVPDGGARFELWVVIAPQDGGALRRDLAFPSDPVAAVRADEWVAFAKKGPLELFRVVLVNAEGQALLLASGQSVALDPGKWRAFAVALAPGQDSRGLEDDALLSAAREAGIDGQSLKLPAGTHQVSGTVLVQP